MAFVARVGAVCAVACALAGITAGSALGAFSDDEAGNYSKTNERYQHLTGTPSFQALLRQKGLEDQAGLPAIAADTERNPYGNLCFQHQDGCAGDVRFYDWDKQPGNIRRGAILWTARSGATISGHVWAVAGGPARKPGVVITNGSVQAPEELYWLQAAALARAGFVVLTWDPQTQGRSDGPGAAPTQNENSSPQSVGAFTDGTVDALDFFTSTPDHPFRPRNSATMPAVNHGDKQARRVAAGRNAGFNPLYAMLDPSRIGIVGHSLGAFAVSQVASEDPRVHAVVAWDQLSTKGTSAGGAGSDGPPLPPRVPGLGLSGDYGIGSPNGAAGVNPKPRESAPDPQGANGASRSFSRAKVPTGQVNTRAGTHFESAVIPDAGFAATLRGNDQYTWYTVAWFQKYLQGSADADRLLLTSRWQRDAETAKIDPTGDPNVFSRDLRSRLDFKRADGSGALCEDLRTGCGVLADDGAGPFSGVDFAYGRQSLSRVRPGRCAAAIRLPRRLDLSRSKRRVKVRLRLNERTRVTARASRRHARTVRRTQTLRAGRRTVVVRLKRRARPGLYRVSVQMRCAGARQSTSARVRVKR